MTRRVVNCGRKGALAERAARVMLNVAGYHTIRAAGSLGKIDLVAIPGDLQPGAPNSVRLLAVKVNRWPPPAQRVVLQAMKLPTYCSVELWRYDDRAGWRTRRWDGEMWVAPQGEVGWRGKRKEPSDGRTAKC